MVSGRELRSGGADGMRSAELTRWEGGILRASMPMAPPLRQVNCYILPEEDGSLTVIDPGPHTAETVLAWEGVLAELGYAWTAVRRIVVTHHHPDHYGLAGWLQERSGGRVWMGERAYREAQMSWGPAATLNDALPQLFARHGMPEPWLAAVLGHLESFAPQVAPQPEVDFIDPAAPFVMGGREWRPLLTGGHAPGHLSFHHAASGQLLCGDAVLPQISPNVGLQPGSDPQPLLTFLDGLRLLESVPVTMAFPGHREPFTGFTARVQSLLLHHEERLNTVAGLLADGPLSGFAVCEALFRSRISSAHQMRFAMSETLAHIAELVRRERAELRGPAAGAPAVYAALR